MNDYVEKLVFSLKKDMQELQHMIVHQGKIITKLHNDMAILKATNTTANHSQADNKTTDKKGDLRTPFKIGTEIEYLNTRGMVINDDGGPTVFIQNKHGNLEQLQYKREGFTCREVQP